LHAPASADCNIVGDANNDNRITAADSVLALQMSVGSVAPDLESADVSGDGRISSLDALIMLTMAQKTQVCVNSPDVVSGTFNVTIDIYNVVDLDSGQFDLSFNSSVVNVTSVYNGSIDGTTVPIDAWNFTDADTIHVDLNSTGGASGSGLLATIGFEVLGEAWASSILDISGGQIADTGSNNTPALWFDSDVTVGVPVTVNSPDVASVVSGTFNVTIDIEDVLNMNAVQFDLSFDSSVVNVTDVEKGLVNGKMMGTEWNFTDSDTICVISKRPGAYTVSGSGHLAVINFTITGSQGNTSILDISDGKLAGILTEGTTDAEEIPSTWTDDEVAVGVPVTVSAHDVASGTFNVTIDIEDVLNMNAVQFDLSFDSSVVNVTDVEKGLVNNKMMGTEWNFTDSDTICVISKRPGAYTVSGSGYLATINFVVTGSGTSLLDISDGKLAGILTEGTTDAEEIQVRYWSE
jgi:azurin